jgi:hypothetical protein
MKSTMIAALPLFAVALAAPTRRSEYDISITLINDQSGAGIAQRVPSGGHPISINGIWGPIQASSAQLNDVNPNGRHVYCEFVVGDDSYELTTEKTWVDLDGVSGPGLVDLAAATVSCYVDGEKLANENVRRSEFDINVTLFNDQTGANDVRGVPSGGYDNSITTLFAGSRLDVGGRIKASAAQLATVFIPGDRRIDCQFKLGGRVVAFSNLATWVDLDGVPGAGLVDLTDGKLSCTVAGEQLSN